MIANYSFDELTADEIARLRRVLDSGLGSMPTPIKRTWPEPTLLTEDEIRDLAPVARPVPPALEADDAEWAVFQRRLSSWEQADFDRCKRLAALGPQRKSQLEAQRAYPFDDQPLWLVSVVGVGDQCPDAGQPPLLIPGATETQAGDRYVALIGLTGGRAGLLNDGRHRQELKITPCPASADA
jgi:hypothetical protein